MLLMGFNEQELRQYVISNPQDDEAFQHYFSIMRAKPGVVVSTPEQLGERKKMGEILGLKAATPIFNPNRMHYLSPISPEIFHSPIQDISRAD